MLFIKIQPVKNNGTEDLAIKRQVLNKLSIPKNYLE